ncbi:MAG: TIM barrel protein [Saccharofermentanales bacterium]
MFEIGLSGQMFDSCSVWEHLQAADELGYASVELRNAHVTPATPVKEQEKIKEYLTQHHLKVNGLSCFIGNFGLLSDDQCETAFDVVKQYIELADFLDADMIRVWPAWQESGKAGAEVWSKTAVWMKRTGEYAQKHHRRIVMEMHHGTLCDTVESSLKLLSMIDCPNVGLTFDPVNLYQVPTTYTGQAIKLLGKHIFNVHIKDIIQLDTDSDPDAFPYSFYAEHISRFTPVKYSPKPIERYFTHRRINQGGVDWQGVLRGLQDIGYQGSLIVESVCESNPWMPCEYKLAECSYQDVMSLQIRPSKIQNWHVHSPEAEGFFEVISPKQSDCRAIHIFRLNLNAGNDYLLQTGPLEMNGLITKGNATISGEFLTGTLKKFDSFYLPGKSESVITAKENLTIYIGAAEYDGFGKPFIREMDFDLPLGKIHQIHGSGAGSREVFFTLDPEAEASRLICGVTWSEDGAWTSWPPHQHENDLEEVYCYFDMPFPVTGFHFSYPLGSAINNASFSVVRDGSMVMAPKGYHPTVSTPGSKNVYFWVMAAHSHSSRRYDLAVLDPNFNYVQN